MNRRDYTIFKLLKSAAEAPAPATPAPATPDAPAASTPATTPAAEAAPAAASATAAPATTPATETAPAPAAPESAPATPASTESPALDDPVGPIDLSPEDAAATGAPSIRFDNVNPYNNLVLSQQGTPTIYPSGYNQPQQPRDPYFDSWNKERPQDNTEEFNNDLAEWDARPDVGYMSQDEYDRETERLASIRFSMSEDDYWKYKPELDARQAELDRARWGDPNKQGEPVRKDPSAMLQDYDNTSQFVQHRDQIFGPDSPRGPGQRVEAGTLPEEEQEPQEPPPVYPEYQKQLDAIDTNPNLTPSERKWYRQQVLSANNEDYERDPNRPLRPSELYRYRTHYSEGTGRPTVIESSFTPGQHFNDKYEPKHYKDPYEGADFSDYSSMENALASVYDKYNRKEISKDDYNKAVNDIYNRQQAATTGHVFSSSPVTHSPSITTVAGIPYYDDVARGFEGVPLTEGQARAYRNEGLSGLQSILDMQRFAEEAQTAGQSEGYSRGGYTLGPNGTINYRLEL